MGRGGSSTTTFAALSPVTFSHGVFGGHETHDLLVRGNRATCRLGPSGKTWRFLVLTGQRGRRRRRAATSIEGLGSRDGDTIPWSNEPEIILTETYHVRYEGKVMAPVGRRAGAADRPAAGRVRCGPVMSSRSCGPGRRRVAADRSGHRLVDVSGRASDPGRYRGGVDFTGIRRRGFPGKPDRHPGREPVGRRCVSSATISAPGSSTIICWGGRGRFKMTACPTETPLFWGWSHAPFLGGVIEANIIEDAEQGGILGVEHDPRYIKSNAGPDLHDGAARTTTSCAGPSRSCAADGGLRDRRRACAGLTLGYQQSDDPGEFVVRAAGNRLEAAGHGAGTGLRSGSTRADYNRQKIVNRRLRLPSLDRPCRPASARPANGRRRRPR